MASAFKPGDAVQTPLGKGIVREARNAGRLLVDIGGRSLVFDERSVTTLDVRGGRAGRRSPASARPSTPSEPASRATSEVDLHGLSVEDALARAEQALNDALLADVAELRVIHGKSGGRIRAALHRRLRAIPTVRAFTLDPGNPGVTIVSL